MRIKLVYLLMFGILCILSTPAMAAVFNMTGNDAGNTSSFYNTGGANMWSPSGLPVSSGDPLNPNVYYTAGWLMRSPASGTGYLSGDFTFAGDKLVVGYSSTGTLGVPFTPGGAAINDALLFKVANQNLTVNNLVLDAGYIRDGLGTGQTCSINGNIFVTSNGGGFNAQCLININSAISGPGPIYIGDNGSGEAGRTVIFTSGASTYTGNIIMAPVSGQPATRSRLTFAAGSIMNFKPLGNGVNNSISGIGTDVYNGAFNIDLTAADNTIGDTWTLISATPASQTYGATFNINGFTSLGDGNTWKAVANSVTYQYTQNDGTLKVVPEPATWIMLVLGAMGIAFYSRKK
jgi:hypothetical protein